MKLLLDDEGIDLLRAWGIPYSWGAGSPKDGINNWPLGANGLAGGRGWDCSGFAQAACVRLGLLQPTDPDRTAAALHDLCVDDVPEGFEFRGDLAFYGVRGVSHVMVVLNTGVVIGPSGGGSATNADDQRAFVKIDRIKYRADFRGVKRLPK